jgi:MoaA/NifB/PqqE/SkfB family radical SAM enzyme
MTERLSLRRRLALDIFRRLREDVVEVHHLRQLFWECTLRCNHHCRHCGSDCKQTALVPDMPMEDFARVLDSVAAATDPHRVMINVTGG